MSSELSKLVLPHLGNADLVARMASFYADIDRIIAAYQPVCRNRGRCCRFDEFGHKLYVSTPEIVYFAGSARDLWRDPGPSSVCPYHVDGRCAPRPFRPLGCRVFFCDPDTRDWQTSEYERGLAELRKIGLTFGVDYRYVEWLSALHDLSPAISEKPPDQAGLTPPAGV